MHDEVGPGLHELAWQVYSLRAQVPFAAQLRRRAASGRGPWSALGRPAPRHGGQCVRVVEKREVGRNRKEAGRERGRWGDEGCPSLRKEEDRNVKRSHAQGKRASSRSYCVVSQIGLPRSAVVVDAPLASRPPRTDATTGKTDAMRPARSLCSSHV
jgi:hypothetical protein